MTRLQLVALCALSAGCLSLGFRSSAHTADVLGEPSNAGRAEMQPAHFSPEFVGMHTLSPTRHWPTVPFGSIRVAGVSWGAVEPARGQYDWHGMDSWADQAQAHGAQLDYVFVNTPLWASTRPDEPCIGKRVGCAAPPNMSDWEEFVTALATRYKGRINSYEIWNEPNASAFWSGSPKDLVDLAAHAYPIIKSIDPAAIVATPCTSSSGWPLAHDAWFDQYFAAGGGKYADVIAWHGYAGRNDRPALPPEGLDHQIQSLRAVMARYNLSQLPIWDTEGGWGRNTQLPDEQEQASFLAKWFLINFTNGVARAYWYQWDNPDWGTLWRQDSGVTAAGAVVPQVYDWLNGTTAVRPCGPEPSSALWVCELQKGKQLYRAAWSTSGSVPFQAMDRVKAYTELGGTMQAPSGKPVIVGSRPVLFQMK